MKTKYKFIHFEAIGDGLEGWSCRNNRTNSELAKVYWYSAWKQFVSDPHEGTIYSEECHGDFQDFLKQLNSACTLVTRPETKP